MAATGAPSFAAAAAASGDQEQVTGNGQLSVGGELRTFAFTAVRHGDGTVSGEYQLINRAASTKIHADITCLSIVGNRAWIGVVATPSSDVPGETAFRVEDNGEGSNAPADGLSLAFVGGGPGFAAFYCAARPAAPDLNPIEGGNIQVH